MKAQRALLELDRVSLTFGGLRALSELELHVDEREVVSVIGPNGAGKTTVFNVITGVYEPNDGDVRFGDSSIAGKSPTKITRLGIARTFQSLRLFLNMSVIENVTAATYGHTKAMPWESILRLPRARREEREVRGRPRRSCRSSVSGWPATAGSSPPTRCPTRIGAGSRSRGRSRRGRGYCCSTSRRPGMNPNETHEITEVIGRLRDELGVAILVIEHDMHVVAGVSDRVVALDHGIKIAEGSFDQVASHPAVVEAYLGRDPEALAESR